MRNLLLLSLFVFSSVLANAQTYGHLNVSATTSNAGGNYAPRNIVAIWVENEEGEFVKTLLAYAQNRITHLNTWQASTNAVGEEFNKVDAVTGATQNNHGTRECLWNGLDYNQNLMPDGTYTLWMELTDKNNTGNYSSFEFIKGEDPQELYPSDVPSFSDISIIWEPSGTGLAETELTSKFTVSPNPGSQYFHIEGNGFKELHVYKMTGEKIMSSKDQSIDLSAFANGFYLFHIESDNGTEMIKVVKE